MYSQRGSPGQRGALGSRDLRHAGRCDARTPRPLTPRRRTRKSTQFSSARDQATMPPALMYCSYLAVVFSASGIASCGGTVAGTGADDGGLHGGSSSGSFASSPSSSRRFIVRRFGRGVLRQRVVWVILWSDGGRFAGVRSAYYVAMQPVRRGPRRSRRRWPSVSRRGRRRHQRRRAMLRHVQRDVRWHQFRRQLRMPSGHLRVLRAHYDRRAVLRLPRLPRAQFGVQRVRTLRFSALSAAPTASTG